MKLDIYSLSILGLIVVAGILVVWQVAPGETIEFDIEDSCGPIVNFISHTIQDESVCQARCRAQCNARDVDFKEVVFVEAERGCHSCTCSCRG